MPQTRMFHSQALAILDSLHRFGLRELFAHAVLAHEFIFRKILKEQREQTQEAGTGAAAPTAWSGTAMAVEGKIAE
ncbi:MAG TPA: hypothetical protein PK953_11895 [Smithellaceae bacterium]|jgi:hypothetical protein|nr:hypothetical protein [Deltaproteobacteria bacterium]HPL10656.1 hypothetical protein [Smithellaceae bacterium]HQC11605.1 hypothetical protein [Smithellaceae bacterium]